MAFLPKVAKIATEFSNIDDDINKRTLSRNIIGFYGCLNNTGTTAILAHVAKSLNTSKEPVVIVDLNAGFPTVYRYFVDEIEEERSLNKKLRNPTFSATELLNFENMNDVNIISFTGNEPPQDYATIDMNLIKSLLNDLASRFTYVLVDLGANLNDDSTSYGLVACNRVYSFVRPITAQLERLIVTHEVFENLGQKNLIYNVIQCQCVNNAFAADEFKDVGMKLFANIDYDYEIMKAIDNCEFVNPVIKNRAVKGFIKATDAIAEDIRQFVYKSSNMNIDARKE
jgi:MinD-like ATPase involved in chromosome partitioning or flagellar assembly